MTLINRGVFPLRAVKIASESGIHIDGEEATSPVGEDDHKAENDWNIDKR